MRLITFGGLKLEEGKSKPKNLLLLAYLAVEGSKTRQHLAELFFMGRANPRGSLSRALSDLRKDAKGSIESDKSKVWFVGTSDFVELLALIEINDNLSAVDLYNGDFAEGFSVDEETELEEWVWTTREYVARRVCEAHLQLAEEAAFAGEKNKVKHHSELSNRILDLELFEVSNYSRLYNLLVLCNSPLAIDVQTHAQNYGIKPNQTFDEIQKQFQKKSIAETPNNLPKAKTSFVGRELELNLLEDQLANPECRLITIHGMGGIGKSRLALEVAKRQLSKDYFVDGIYFMQLDLLQKMDFIPALIADQIEIKIVGGESPLDQIIKYLQPLKVLLILDNSEHLTYGTSLLSELLEKCPEIKLVITSRKVLGIQEEWIQPLSGLDYPTSILGVDALIAFPATLLFAERIKRNNIAFEFDDINFQFIVQICQILEGVPLAIELAASWFRVLSLYEILLELKKDFGILGDEIMNLNPTQKNIWTVIEKSWQLLDNEGQIALASLSVFKGSFSRTLAGEVVNMSITNLIRLSDASLVSKNSSEEFYLHKLIHVFARGKLRIDKDYENYLCAKHAEFFYKYVQNLAHPRDSDAIELVHKYIDEILVAAFWLVNHGFVSAINNIFELVVYFDSKAKFIDGYHFYKSLSENNFINDLLKAKILTAQVWFCFRLSYFEEGEKLAKVSIKLQEGFNEKDPKLLMLTHHYTSVILMQSGNSTNAKLHSKYALEIAERIEDSNYLPMVLTQLALIEEKLSKFNDAFLLHNKALELYQAIGTKYGIVVGLSNLGMISTKLNKFEDSRHIFHEALKVAQNSKILSEIPYIYYGLAITHYNLDEKQRSLEYCCRILESGDLPSESEIKLLTIELKKEIEILVSE